MIDVKSFLSFTLNDVEEYAQSLNCPERLGVGPSIVLPNGDVYDLTSVNLDGDATHFTFFHLIFDSLAQDLRDEYPDDEDIDYEIYELDDDRRIMDYVESDLGIVTLNEGRTYVEPRAKLVALKKPTDAQYEVIEEYLDEVQKYKSAVYCFLTDKSDFVSYRFDENTTDEIIEKIKRTFAFGRVFEGVSNKKTLYRDGQVDDWSNGLFFADDLRYYDYNDNFDAEDTRAYEVDFSNAKIFDPMKEWDLYVNTWSDIRQTKEFFDEKGFDYYEYLDDVDYDDTGAYHEVITDTDALASYAKEHNYDAVVFRDIHSDGGRGPAFNEYCIFNKDIVKSKTITESSKESTRDKTGREYNIWTECTGGYSGQSDYMKIAYVGDNWMDEHDRIIRDNILGYLQYAVADDDEDTAYIQMIEVKESERRKGIATALIDSLKKEYKEINWGYTTNDGTKFYKSYNKINESAHYLFSFDLDAVYFDSVYECKNYLIAYAQRNYYGILRMVYLKDSRVWVVGDGSNYIHMDLEDQAVNMNLTDSARYVDRYLFYTKNEIDDDAIDYNNIEINVYDYGDFKIADLGNDFDRTDLYSVLPEPVRVYQFEREMDESLKESRDTEFTFTEEDIKKAAEGREGFGEALSIVTTDGQAYNIDEWETHPNFFTGIVFDEDSEIDELDCADYAIDDLGVITLNSGGYYEERCKIVMGRKPTEAQYRTIENWLETLYDNEVAVVTVYIGYNHADFDLSEYTAQDVIKSIKRFFVTGMFEALNEKIVKKGNKWQVQSEKGRNMGTYDTKAEAEKRLKQVHYFKHVNEDKEDYQKKFDERTHAHIDRVNKYAKKIDRSYPNHDEDKFNELYAGYSLMSKNKEDITKEEQAMIDDATFKHVINNEHHCEHWVDPKDIEGFSRDNPTPHGCLDCSKMPESALEEMCCDWCAMSEEFGNTPFEWYEKNKDTRWHFNEEQDKFILDTLHKLWDTEKMTEDLQETDNEGHVLSKEQIEFFKNSKVRNKKGELVVCYHSTKYEFDTFNRDLAKVGLFGDGMYFSTNSENIFSYGDKYKVVYLNLENPVILHNDDLYLDADVISTILVDTTGEFDSALYDSMYHPFGDRYLVEMYYEKVTGEHKRFDELAEMSGYDGIIVLSNEDIENRRTEIEVFLPNAIKSVDNKNPTNSNNINEDLQETDDEGNPLSKEQIAFFKDSSIRDNAGKLLVVYHGTDKKFDKFAKGDIGFHFGTKGQATAVANEFPSNTGKVDAYYLNIKNPAFMYDFGDTGPISTLFWWWSQSFDEYGSIFDFDMTEDELKQINDVLSARGISLGTGAETDIGDDAEAEDFDSSIRHADMYNSSESRLLRKLLKARGYDGIYYQNNFEDSDSINGDISFIAFDANQIKSIDNKNPTNSDNVNEGSSGVPNKQKYQNKKLKKNIVKIAKECGFNGIIDTKELSVHHLSDVYENGLKDNSYKNIWFIKSEDWKDRELLHKLLHYMDRNDVSYQELLNKLEEIKLYQYDDVNNRFVEKTLSTFRESLTESKQDDENFKKWLNNAYEEVGYQWSSPEIDVSDYMSNADACYSLFQSYRKDNSGKETDYYYWMKREPEEFFSFLARYTRKNKDKRELIDKENSGAERIAENNFWYVYKITSYEASRKYGRNTTWCITDEYDWNSYRDDWGIEYFLFFIPKDDSKYMRHAVGVSDNEVQMIFNQEDCKVEGIPNVPTLPDGYPQIPDALDYDFYTYFDLYDGITEANIKDAAEAGVNWLDYLWFLGNDEDEIKDILQNDFHIDMNESLTEAKADTERFLKWISDGYKSMKYSDWASGVYAKEAVNVFNKYKNSLKGEQRDIYSWMKKPFSDFASLISSLKKKDDEKSEVARKEDEGSELVYENDDWLVYEITNYEASVKYGKGTKWCISGSKRWENGKNGREHWDGYHESGIIFYFFINRKNGRKYALAIYPDMEHYEIFNDADIAVSYIPDAPFVKQVASLIDGEEHRAWYATVTPKHEIQRLIAEGKVDFDFIKQYLNDSAYNYREGTLILYNDVDDFVTDLDWSIPDEYLEWEAVADDKMSVEQYKKLTGHEYEEEWTGDVPQISNWSELKNWEKGKEAALDKSNFDSGFYLIANEDDGEELWSYHKDLPDALLEFSRYSPDILNEITQRIFTDLERGSITVKDVFNAFDLSEDTKDNLKQMYESLSHSSCMHAIINEKTGTKMRKKELRKQIDALSESELDERIAQLESDAKKLFEAKSEPNSNDAFLLSYAKMVKARDYARESLKEEKESVDSVVLDDEYLSFDEFLDRAEVIVVDDAKTFDINEYEANLMSEIEEELCEEQDVDIKSAFTKYRLDDERLKKVIEKLSKSEFNIVDYWKTKQFMKKNGLTKEDLSFVLRNLKDEDYKTNSISNDNKHNEAMIFVKDSSVGNLGPFSLYIKLDYDSVEENPVIVISFHQRRGSKKKTDSESIVSGLEEDIEKHDELNQKLFDGDELRQDVKDKVVEIANAFVDELKNDGIKFNLKDIVLIGSNVNYNYTKDSDLDIHLIADSEGLECPDELYPLLYSAYRSIFNKNYDITIKGIPAEIYVEMDEPQGVSNGIYSIENGWVKKPVQTDIPDIDREKLDDELSKWEDKYFELRDKIEYALASTEHPLDESLIRESALDESAKTDFIAKFGEDTAKNFEKAKQRLLNKGLSVDYGQYLKYDKKQVDDILLSLYDDKKDAQKKRVMSGKTREVRGKYNFLGEKNGYLVYEPLDYVASMDLGINTGWCTTGRYLHAGHPEYTPSAKDAKNHWNDYMEEGVRFFYFLDSSTFYGEYALALYPRTIDVNEFVSDDEYLESTNFELFNQKDNLDYSALNSLPIDLINAKLVIKTHKTVNGLLLSDDGTEIVGASKSLTSITVPDSVTSIGDEAFFRCTFLVSITIPNSVTKIGYRAFSQCFSLKSIKIPNSVTSIGRYAFYNCHSLVSIIIPNSVTSIGEEAFRNCESLKSIAISNSITKIENGVFYGCESLKSVKIPDSVTSIDEYAFFDCTSLKSITIPDSVTSIGRYALWGSESLTVHTNSEYVIQYCEEDDTKYVRDVHESLKEEYVDDDKEIFTTESPYEVANMLRSSEKALRILYDRKLKRFFVCDADELIHREMVDAAWERGYYAQLAQSGVLRGKWELDSYLDDYGGHVIYYIYAPLDKVADTYGSEVNEDGYEGKYVYDFGVVTTRSDDKYKSSPLGKALGKYEHHYVQDGWIDDYTPKIIEVA